MTKILAFRPLLATSLPLAACVATVAWSAANSGAAPAAKSAAKPAVKTQAHAKAMPPANADYLPLDQIKAIQRQRANAGQVPGAALQPMINERPINVPMRDLLSGPVPDLGGKVPDGKGGWKKVDPKAYDRYAQNFPRPVPPASVRNFAPATPTLPKWVRYPLEFQLAGIGLGTRAVDKDRFNRIDRYGLFALHGNPTAVVRAVESAAAGGGADGGGSPGGSGGSGGSRGGIPGGGAPGGEGGGAAAAPTNTNLTLLQTPPEVTSLFPPTSPQGGLPAWALAVTVQLDQNHVEWLYKRDDYQMGFVVDRLGFVDAVIVAGTKSDISSTQLEDPVHTVKLGDDFRKVVFRYGYPDDIVPLAADPAAVANSVTGAPGGGAAGGGAAGGLPGGAGGSGGSADAGGGDAGGAAAVADNAAFRTYDLRYEQSYNVVFTIRNNRVVRIYIFGDPDFFNAQRRNTLRNSYNGR